MSLDFDDQCDLTLDLFCGSMDTQAEQEDRLNTEGSDRLAHILFVNCGRALAQAIDEQDLLQSVCNCGSGRISLPLESIPAAADGMKSCRSTSGKTCGDI